MKSGSEAGIFCQKLLTRFLLAGNERAWGLEPQCRAAKPGLRSARVRAEGIWSAAVIPAGS